MGGRLISTMTIWSDRPAKLNRIKEIWMEKFTIYEILHKLIGPVYPACETNEDERRFENLKNLISLTDHLLGDIDTVSTCKNKAEFSAQRAGKCASDYLDRIGIRDD